MKEIKGNLWTQPSEAIIAVTTNGIVDKFQRLVMGRGCAQEAAALCPNLPRILGKLVADQGNHAHYVSEYNIVSFPTKNHWRDNSDIELIRQSAREVVYLADQHGWTSVIIPRPGTGYGRLQWPDVKKVLEGILDDRFSIITF